MQRRNLQPLWRSIGRVLISSRRDAAAVFTVAVADLIAAAPNAASMPQVVETEGGPVTLVELAALKAHTEGIQREAVGDAQNAKSLHELAENLWVQVGTILLANLPQWSPSPEVAGLTREALPLSASLAADVSALDSIHASQHGGISGLAGKLGSWNQDRKLTSDRAQLESELRPLLQQIARQSPQVDLLEIASIRGQAVAAEGQAQELELHAASLAVSAKAASDELKRRTDADRDMGFDAPYLGAYLKTYGPQEVQSPLIPKRGERAALVVPATLARQQTRRQWVGGSQGVSFPIGHTGIRYRVGSFHGHPIQQQSLSNLDTGTLVVTNQRIAFIGKVKSTSIPFAKLLHVECYSDAVAVFQEGRENPDFYLTAQPKYALFMLNWFLNQAT